MSDTTPTQMQVAIRYGAIGSLLLIIVSMILYLTGVMSQGISSALNIAVMGSVIALGIKFLRDESPGGGIQYGRGLGTGTLISLVMAVVMVPWTFLFYNVVAPDFKDKILDISRERMSEQGMDSDQVDAAMEGAAFFFSTPFFAIMGFFMTLLLGFLISLIASAILRKEDKPGNVTEDDVIEEGIA